MTPGWELADLPLRNVAIAAGVGSAVAILLLLLRPRPPVVEVSSHLLWERVLPRRRNPLLWELLMLALQVAAISAIALALGGPVFRRVADGDGTAGVLDRIWIVDRSLSMGAVEPDGVPRIERVAHRLRDELADLDPRVRVGVIGAGGTPGLLAPLGNDRQRVSLALRLLDVAGTGADLTGALELARSQPGLRCDRGLIELFTDAPGADALARDWQERSGCPVRVRAPFSQLPNVAITAFDLRASEGIPAEEEALVRLANLSPWNAAVLLRLETHDAVLGEAHVDLAPGAEETRRYRFRPLAEGGVEAVLREVSFEADGAPADALAADDRAFSFVQPVLPVRVMLVSHGNRYLERVLALLPGAHLEVLSPSQWDARAAARADLSDVVFLDGFVPRGRQPARAFYVDPPPGGPFTSTARLSSPAVTDWNHEHPLLEGLVLRDLNVLDSQVLEEEPGDVRLIGSPSGALALAREDGAARRVGWGFDFARSDLPLRLAFPQLVVGTLLWMRRDRALGPSPGGRHLLADPLWVGLDGPAPGQGAVVVGEGDPRPHSPVEDGAGPGGGGGTLAVTDLLREAASLAGGDPRGAARATLAVAVGDGPFPVRFPHPGLWRVRGPGWRTDLAVNVFEPEEGRLSDLPSGDSSPVSPPPPPGPPPREWGPPWAWLGFLAALLLLCEFWAWTR